MSTDIHIHRDHRLGLAKARQVAAEWIAAAEQKFDLACTRIEGDVQDKIEFRRTGLSGELVVAADHFDLTARLGFLLGAFGARIQSEIEGNLDTLLGSARRVT